MEVTKDTHKINSFGVGSFVFRVISNEIQKTEVHISAFLDELRKIPGVENVSIKPDPLVPKYITPDEDGIILSFLDMEFDIDLSAGDFSVEGENKFKFISRNEFDSAVTTISPYFKTENPSDGVMRVREHINSFLNDPYVLKVVGPSPFHADFFVNRTNFFGVDIEKVYGYDSIRVHVSSNDDGDVIEEIYEKLAVEFNLFYLIHHIETIRQEYWVAVEEQVSRVLLKPNFLSFSIQDQFTFRYDYLGKAMSSLAEFEATSLSLSQLINERFNGTYSMGEDFLSSYIEDARNGVYKYPVESTRDLLKFIADARGRTQGTLTTYVNTIINVILGLGVALVLYFFLGIK